MLTPLAEPTVWLLQKYDLKVFRFPGGILQVRLLCFKRKERAPIWIQKDGDTPKCRRDADFGIFLRVGFSITTAEGVQFQRTGL